MKNTPRLRLVVPILALMALAAACTLRERSGPVTDIRRPGSYPAADPDARRPPSVGVRVVPSEVTFPKARHLVSPEVEALAGELWSTETARLFKKRPEPFAVRSLEDTSFGARAPEPVSTLGHSFEGLDQVANQLVTPPDPHGAVGPDHVMSVMNITVAWYGKDGTLENWEFLRDFFVDSMDVSIIADPRVMYDDHADRFVVTTLEITTSPWTSRLLVAVSDTGDPNGTWTQTSIDTLLVIGDTTFGDYPALALDEEALYLTTNHYRITDFLLVDARVFVIDKGLGSGGLYDGGPASVSVLDPPGEGLENFSLSPARIHGVHPDPSVGTYFTSYNGFLDGENNAILKVLGLIDPLTAPAFQQEYASMGPIDNLAPTTLVPQWSGGRPLDNGGRLVMSNSVWRDGVLYVATELTPATGPDLGHGIAHWVQMDATTPSVTTVLDQGNIGAQEIAPETRSFWPTVAVNDDGAMGVSFSLSGPNIHAGAGFAYRLPADPPGTTRPIEILRSGVAPYVFLDGVRNRWGDYTGVDSDPATGCFWSFNEYAKGWNRWGTAWGEHCPEWVCGNDVVDPGESCDPPGSPAGQPEVCRAGCSFCGDGLVDRADGELCDDGNNVAGDGCAADCTPEHCGDGSVMSPESCDPPALPAELPTDCRAECSRCGDEMLDGGGNLIVNGDFESGTLFGWTLDSAGDGSFSARVTGDFVPISGWPTQANPTGDEFFAVGDSRDPGTQAMSQSFTVPHNATSVVLEFEMFVNNWNRNWNHVYPPPSHPGTFIDPAGLDHTTPNPNQHARVDILNPGFGPFDTSGEAVVRNVFRGSDPLAPPTNPYTTYSFDITSFVRPGQTYRLRFASTQNQIALNLGVDNVRLLVGPGEGCDDGNNETNDGCQSFCEPCPAGLFPTVRATSKTELGWDAHADVTWVVGDLTEVASLTGTQQFASFAEAVEAPVAPPAGAGAFYLFRFDCPDATWSSGGAGETGDRDLLLP